jgi:hypothetical protein
MNDVISIIVSSAQWLHLHCPLAFLSDYKYYFFFLLLGFSFTSSPFNRFPYFARPFFSSFPYLFFYRVFLYLIRGPRESSGYSDSLVLALNSERARDFRFSKTVQTSHFQLMPRLRMSGVIPLLPLYASMAKTGEPLSFLCNSLFRFVFFRSFLQ